ncbi:ATP-binding protein [Marinifilum sp. RC60d5]|uniref:ATP-binding protein n=1 Tax=Marinifilum sp. RC60d5 TaxID=3458414 RepID=UPI0040357A2D
MIEQVLHNLISNAIKYSTPNTTISNTIAENNSNITIAIKYQGVDIPEGELSKLFTEFGKTSAITKANESSTGLSTQLQKKL